MNNAFKESLAQIDLITVIGAGGTGSYLTPALARLLRANDAKTDIVIVDRDKIEDGNLDRQDFDGAQIGMHKALALASLVQTRIGYPCAAKVEWWSQDNAIPTGVRHFFFCCADNHPARLWTLQAADQADCHCIIAGNGFIEFEAYYYKPAWEGTERDPRRRMPELITDKTDDPTRPSCTALAQAPATAQTVIANMSAAAAMLSLFWTWLGTAPLVTDPMSQTLIPFQVDGFKTKGIQ